MSRTFIIAEAGINHNGKMQDAKDLIEAAKESGADAVKFQTYQTEKRVDTNSPIYDILKKCELDYDQQTELKVYADKVGIEFFSTPFDEQSLSFLIERLGVRRIKLASFDVTNTKFLMAVNEYAQSLPTLRVLLSTGMSNAHEISNALLCLQNTPYLTLLHCISSYPTPENEVNLSAIWSLKHLIHGPRSVGYSDHTSDILAPALAVIAGATTIEKHFTLDMNNGAPDNPVSADPSMMRQMVDVIRMHEEMMGDGLLKMRDVEKNSELFRRRS